MNEKIYTVKVRDSESAGKNALYVEAMKHWDPNAMRTREEVEAKQEELKGVGVESYIHDEFKEFTEHYTSSKMIMHRKTRAEPCEQCGKEYVTGYKVYYWAELGLCGLPLVLAPFLLAALVPAAIFFKRAYSFFCPQCGNRWKKCYSKVQFD